MLEQNFGNKIVGNVQIGIPFFFSSVKNYLVFARVCLTKPCDWLKNIAPLSQPIRFGQLWPGYMHFPALRTCFVNLLRKLIVSFVILFASVTFSGSDSFRCWGFDVKRYSKNLYSLTQISAESCQSINTQPCKVVCNFLLNKIYANVSGII